MRISLLPFVITITITMVLPVIPSSLLPRSNVCANDGKSKVGSLFTGRGLSTFNITPRVMPRIPCYWCLRQTSTAIFIQYYDTQTWTPYDAPRVLTFLSEVLNEVRQHLSTNTDGPIPNGRVFAENYMINWSVVNDNNHQVTWGVMGSAVETLTNFMVLYGFGTADFTIMDGPNVVGHGSLRPVLP